MELHTLSASQRDHTQKAGESEALLVASGPFLAAMIAFLSASEDHEDYTQDSRCILPWECQCICQLLLGISPAGGGWPAVWSIANLSKQTSFSVALSTVVELAATRCKATWIWGQIQRGWWHHHLMTKEDQLCDGCLLLCVFLLETINRKVSLGTDTDRAKPLWRQTMTEDR